MSRRPTDLTGRRFGKLTVTAYEGKRGKRHYWACICDCGKTVVTSSSTLMQGYTRSCGCLHIMSCEGRRKRMEYNGESLTFAEWADRLGMKEVTLRHYIYSGVPLGHIVENGGHKRTEGGSKGGRAPRIHFHDDIG